MRHETFRIRRAESGDEPLLRKTRIEALSEAPEAFGSTLQFEPLAGWSFLPYLAYLNYAALICYKYWKLNETPG